jgi:hypothetical protein
MKSILFSKSGHETGQAQCGGGCHLDASVEWPEDAEGNRCLHLMTFPAQWIDSNSPMWLSVFMPCKIQDTFYHWDLLAASKDNTSRVILHNNSGEYRNEFADLNVRPFVMSVKVDDTADSDKVFKSKISQEIAWLQDIDELHNVECQIMFDGDDLDSVFGGDLGLFTDGYVYIFLPTPPLGNPVLHDVGKLTFQFS